MKIVFASSNAGKWNELNALLQPYGIALVMQHVLGVSDIPETQPTFIENALLKARHACRVTGLPAIADDSGLAVCALNGEPGIYSARYAGPQCSVEDNIKKLLTALQGVPEEKRQAVFHCILVYLKHEQDPTPLICEGRWEGVMLTEKRGANGFGYDPIFYDPLQHKTAAELSLAIKNHISHRGQALRCLIAHLR